MSELRYTYPARLEPQEDGSLLVQFLDLPEALTDGADRAEALAEAADCLSEALAGRIHRGEEIPLPSPLREDLYGIAPEPTIALKAALYEALKKQGISISELARRLGLDDREAARLLDPRARTRLTSLEAALAALGYEIGIEVREKRIA
jgi:antitoxin HicB